MLAHRATWRFGEPGCHCLPTAHCSCTSTGGALVEQVQSTAWMGSAAPWRWAWVGGRVVGVPCGRSSWYLSRSVPLQMHVVHMNTRYQSMGEARGHPDGLAVLAVLLVVREKLCNSWQ